MNPLDTWSRRPASGLRATWLGHSTLLLELDGARVLTDPVFGERASPLGFAGPRRFHPVPATIAELPPLDAVLLSHDHFDHLCKASVRELAARRVPFVTSLGVGAHLEAYGVEPGLITELDWWEQADLGCAAKGAGGAGLRLHFTPAQHWSRRTPWDTNASLWGGYMIEWRRRGAPDWRFLFPGDTGYSADFKAIRARLGVIDFLALPIGAYLPRDFMKNMHVNPADAVQLMLDLEARQAMGVHWGTFMLTQESFDQPPRDLATALGERGLAADRVWLMRHGETRTIPLS